MLVVISDLHFEEEASDNIPGQPPVRYSRNLPPKVYRSFFAHLATQAERNRAKNLDLVLAGDVFDIHRTSLWFQDNPAQLSPYVNNNQVGPDLERLLLKILSAIQEEDHVKHSLSAIRRLSAGKYWSADELSFPVPVRIHYLPGNHDRLANATPAIRRAVRLLLGIPESDKPHSHVLTFPRYGTLIRHGHEYDRYNFARDYSQEGLIPLHLPDAEYDQPPFGDFATVDIASRFPRMFRDHHGDENIRQNRLLQAVYLRLLEFDDLRPQSAMLNFLLHIASEQVDPLRVWKAIEPIIYQLLEEIHDHPFLKEWLDKMDQKWRLDAIDVIQTALALKSWRLAGIPLGLAQFVSNTIIGSQRDRPGVATIAAREQAIRSGEYRFLVAGHTHRAATELLACDRKSERYYVDTGTWRNRIPATPDYKSFGHLKALTYVIIYGPDEDPGDEDQGRKLASFDFWTGITQRWFSKTG